MTEEAHSSESMDSTISVASNASSTDKSHISSKIQASGNKSPEKCSICLCAPENRCFTDTCVHEFCFVCLLEWSKVKAECPLCKQKFRNIIHNIRSHKDYDEYEVKPPANTSNNGSFGVDSYGRRFRYGSTMTFERLELLRHIRQMQLQLDNMRQNQHFSHGMQRETEHLQRLRYLYERSAQNQERLMASAEFRRMIYDRGLRVRENNDDDRIRDTSPEFYSRNPAMTFRLVPWLQRELGVLLDNNISRRVTHAVSYILNAITRHAINSLQFRQRVATILLQHTDHFCHEFYHFARSPLNMDEYDRQAHYQRFADGPAGAPNAEENAELITLNSPSNSPEPRFGRDGDSYYQRGLELIENAERRLRFHDTEAERERYHRSVTLQRSLDHLRQAVARARSKWSTLRPPVDSRQMQGFQPILSSSSTTTTLASTNFNSFRLLPTNSLFSNVADNGSTSTAFPTSFDNQKRSTSPVVISDSRRKRTRWASIAESNDDDQPGTSSTYPRNPSPVSSQYSYAGPIVHGMPELSERSGDDSFVEVVHDNNSRNRMSSECSSYCQIASSPSSSISVTSAFTPVRTASVASLLEQADDSAEQQPIGLIHLSSPHASLSSPIDDPVDLIRLSSPMEPIRLSSPGGSSSPIDVESTTFNAVMPSWNSPLRNGVDSNRSWNNSPISIDSRLTWSDFNDDNIGGGVDDDDDDDDIEIVAELKPKSQRTPEIVFINDSLESDHKPETSGYSKSVEMENGGNVFENFYARSSSVSFNNKSSHSEHRESTVNSDQKKFDRLKSAIFEPSSPQRRQQQRQRQAHHHHHHQQQQQQQQQQRPRRNFSVESSDSEKRTKLRLKSVVVVPKKPIIKCDSVSSSADSGKKRRHLSKSKKDKYLSRNIPKRGFRRALSTDSSSSADNY